MAFCGSCGTEVAGAAFCPKCGAAQGGAVAVPPTAASPTAGIEENVAGLLSYILGWITGLIFLLIDKRPFVKFHAAQSIAFNIAIVAVYIAFGIVGFVVTMIGAAIHLPIGFFMVFLWPIIGIGVLIAWIFVMYKAYSHEKYKLPIIGDIVENMVK
jgi:uncharacterized membrane protein